MFARLVLYVKTMPAHPGRTPPRVGALQAPSGKPWAHFGALRAHSAPRGRTPGAPWAPSGKPWAHFGALRAHSAPRGRTPGAPRRALGALWRTPARVGALQAHSGPHGRTPARVGALRPAWACLAKSQCVLWIDYIQI